MITVYDFCELATDDSYLVSIFDLDTETEVFDGTMRDAMDCDFFGCTVMSFDVDGGVICLNIDTRDGKD